MSRRLTHDGHARGFARDARREGWVATQARLPDGWSIEWDSGDCASQLPGEQAYTIGGEPAGRLLCYEAGIGPDTGDCSASAPGEQGYTIGGEPAGRLLCTESVESAWFEWTHVPSAISGTISSDLDQAQTWDWWFSDSGP